jgi:hypothetical protein
MRLIRFSAGSFSPSLRARTTGSTRGPAGKSKPILWGAFGVALIKFEDARFDFIIQSSSSGSSLRNLLSPFEILIVVFHDSIIVVIATGNWIGPLPFSFIPDNQMLLVDPFC